MLIVIFLILLYFFNLCDIKGNLMNNIISFLINL
jgi:hypothetical protein